MYINYAFNTAALIYTIKLWYSGTFMYVSGCVLCVYMLVMVCNSRPCGHHQQEMWCTWEEATQCEERCSCSVCVCTHVSSHRNHTTIAPSIKASSVLCAPNWATKTGAAGRKAAAVVRRWRHHAAEVCLPTHPGHNFTRGIGYRSTSLQRGVQKERES